LTIIKYSIYIAAGDWINKQKETDVRNATPILVLILALPIFMIPGCGDNSNGPDNNPPNAPSSPSPANGATDQSLNLTLSWDCSEPDGDPMTFDVYFGTAETPAVLSENQTAFSYDVDNLSTSTTYYWMITAKDDHGHETDSPIWSFTTVGSPACNIDGWNSATHLFAHMYEPSLTADGQTMYLSDTEKIYVSTKSGGSWSIPEELPEVINEPGAIGEIRNPSITGDGSTLYYYRGIEGSDVPYWYSTKVNETWQTPQPVDIEFGDLYPTHHFLISWDGTKFWFSAWDPVNPWDPSDDIYYCESNGSIWSNPVSFDEINSEDYREMDMAVSGDGNTFYFVSAGRPEVSGLYSIWITCFIGGQWSEPVPMGDAINMTNYSERYTPAVTFDGSQFYFGAYDGAMSDVGIFFSNSTE